MVYFYVYDTTVFLCACHESVAFIPMYTRPNWSLSHIDTIGYRYVQYMHYVNDVYLFAYYCYIYHNMHVDLAVKIHAS